MKTLLIAAAAFALAGTGIASAQTSVGADVDLNARNTTTHAGTHTTVHKRKHHRATTGSGRSYGIETNDNNASARGSLLPGKDRDFSEKYIGAK